MKFMCLGDSIETFITKAGPKSVRRLVVLGSDSDLAEQLCTIDLPGDSPAVGKGSRLEVGIAEVSNIFNGKPRLRAVEGSLKLVK